MFEMKQARQDKLAGFIGALFKFLFLCVSVKKREL